MISLDKYLSEKYAILDGTLIALRTEETEVVIPSQVCGHPIKRIGGGSCIAENARLIRVEEGIREIGSMAFSGCGKLQKLILPEGVKLCEKNMVSFSFMDLGKEVMISRRMSKETYDLILQHSFPVESGERMVQSSKTLISVLQGVLDGFSVIYRQVTMNSPDTILPPILDPRMKSLYFIKYAGILMELPFSSERERIEVIGSADLANDKAEMVRQRRRLVKMLLKEMPEGLYDNASELLHDHKLRNHGVPFPYYLTYVRFREEDAQESGESVVIPFRMTFGKAFYATLVRVVFEHKDYYVYRRNFLMGEKDQPIFREDCLEEIYDENGEPISEEMRRIVLTKYLLTSEIQ